LEIRLTFDPGEIEIMDDIRECPHCGSLSGFFRKCYIKGETEYHHNFPGTVIVSEGIVGCSGPGIQMKQTMPIYMTA
jgi:hypothetical protein